MKTDETIYKKPYKFLFLFLQNVNPSNINVKIIYVLQEHIFVMGSRIVAVMAVMKMGVQDYHLVSVMYK